MMLRIFLALFLVASCSTGVKMISNIDQSDLYGDEFLQQIGAVKEQYRQGMVEQALVTLKRMNEEVLTPPERAYRRNLIGVIHFSNKEYEQAIYNFDLAVASSTADRALSAQVYLNLASSYFRLGFSDKAFSSLDSFRVNELPRETGKKYYLLRYEIAKNLGKSDVELISLVHYLGDKKNLGELKESKYFEYLLSGYNRLGKRAKLRVLEEFEDDKFLCINYLGYLEVEKLYYGGNKDDAKDLLEWVSERAKDQSEINELLENFVYRMGNVQKMDPRSIGVILPISGKKKNYGKRALMGIDSALSSQSLDKRLKVYSKDSKGSGAVGAFRVRELIDNYHVSAIIGGLYPKEATKEYLEAKKHGVLFISLSQIYLPKDKKDHLLIEIPGSIESQMGKLFSSEMLEKFGKRGAILYPDNNRGQAYIDEFWRMSRIKEVDVSGVNSYKAGQTDYRRPIKNLLGLEFPRERKEELELLKEIHSLEKSTSIRRVQTLKPQIDFDWIFVPAYPKAAQQIIPSFRYMDAFDLTIIGGPSWRSHSLSKQSVKLGNLYFVGDDLTEESNRVFSEEFKKRHGRRPKVIEMRAYDAFSIVQRLLKGASFESRDDFDIFVRSQGSLNGVTGQWNLSNGIWIKDLTTSMIKRGRISKFL